MAMNYNGSPDEICRIVANGLEQEYKKIIQEHLQHFLDEAKKEMVINDALATRRFIMQELFEHAKNTEKISDRLRALEMMGKSIGMFADTADKDEDDLDVEKLKKELKAKMASMFTVTLPDVKQ